MEKRIKQKFSSFVELTNLSTLRLPFKRSLRPVQTRRSGLRQSWDWKIPICLRNPQTAATSVNEPLQQVMIPQCNIQVPRLAERLGTASTKVDLFIPEQLSEVGLVKTLRRQSRASSRMVFIADGLLGEDALKGHGLKKV